MYTIVLQVLYAIKCVEKVLSLPSTASSDTFAAEIEETQHKLASCREEFLAQYATKGAHGDVIAVQEGSADGWSLVTDFAVLEEDALMLAFKVCPRLKAFGSVEFLQDSAVYGFAVGDRVESLNVNGSGTKAWWCVSTLTARTT